jgi:uncharacterized protein DUF6629
MCFSPEADLATGVVVGAIGVDALRHVQRPQQLVLASLPLLFAAHQIDESVVWWGLRGQVSDQATHTAIYMFLAVAFLLPFLVPLAMFDIEPVEGRRRWMAALLAMGTVTSAFLLIHIITGPVGATIDGHHIAYTSGGSDAFLLGVLYVLATCGALLVASSHLLRAFGLVNLAMVIALSWLTFTGLTSLWCAWAAISSVVVAIYLRKSRPRVAITPPLGASA